MTPGGRYLAGLAVVALIGTTAIIMSPDHRLELASGIGLGLLVQAPLGWLTIRSLGTPRFQAIWLLGMGARLATVAVAGLILLPALGWPMVPALAGLVGTVLVLLLVEVVTVARDTAGMQTR